MAKAKKSVFFCQNCGHEESKWQVSVRCVKNGIHLWKKKITVSSGGKSGIVRSGKETDINIVPLAEVSTDEDERIKTQMQELDRVLGGGIVEGSLVLVGGDPGIGKSTLLLQVCQKLSSINKKVYIFPEKNL